MYVFNLFAIINENTLVLQLIKFLSKLPYIFSFGINEKLHYIQHENDSHHFSSEDFSYNNKAALCTFAISKTYIQLVRTVNCYLIKFEVLRCVEIGPSGPELSFEPQVCSASSPCESYSPVPVRLSGRQHRSFAQQVVTLPGQ
jgi:hypothetical protein